jgi:protein gp37
MPGFVGAVWNPSVGCTRVSDGCTNCYAFALHDKRYKANRDALQKALHLDRVPTEAIVAVARGASDARVIFPWPRQYDLPFSRVQLLPERLDAPIRTRKPTCYFVDSMADLFHEDVPDDYIDRVFLTMAKARQHRFLVLTKRPERMRSYMDHFLNDLCYEESGCPVVASHVANVWLGTSVEDQASADERIPHLLGTPATVRFLSCEPLLGPVDLTSTHTGDPHWSALRGSFMADLPGVDWVIVGGESGPRARPMDLAWARSLREQCHSAGVAFFMKQLGSRPVVQTVPVASVFEAHGRDMGEWPEDLRVRDWPR